ncbi:MAG TPA: hypothetical protein VF463_08475 [Sphingobium sp.]
MFNYRVLTPLRGLIRIDVPEANAREPIEPGEVVRLPWRTAARELTQLGAIEETAAEPTVRVQGDDFDTSLLSLAPIGQATGVALVAVNDRAALAAAISDLGAIVFYPGEGDLPDHAFDVLADFNSSDLLSELVGRVTDGDLLLSDFPPQLVPPPAPPVPPAALVPASTTDPVIIPGERPGQIAGSVAGVSDAAKAALAVKPAAKPKPAK